MMDNATTEALTEAIRRAVRTEEVEAALGEFGWREALEAEGLGVAALLFAEQGAAGATSGALDDVLARALGLAPGPDTAVVLPQYGQTTPPGDGSAVCGLGTIRLASAPTAVVVGDGRAFVVPAGRLRLTSITGVDPSLRLARVEGSLSGAEAGPEIDWSAAVAAGQLSLSYELIGASRAILALAREHALVRTQFDRPIAAFQAVRHRLAESLVAVEGARAAADVALEVGDPLLAAMAKALAGRAARTVARHCQQVLAGIGFTDEHPFHGYFRRVLTLDGLLGSAKALTGALGRDLLRTRAMPAAPPL